MNRPKIVADDKIPFLKGALEPFADIVYLPGAAISADDVRDADVIFTRTRTKCNASLLADSNVKLIATATIGYDHIDTDCCDSASIRWVNAPGCNSFSVQQYITATLCSLVFQRGLKFKDLTIGIIGVGNVGSKVMKAAEALGMKVLLNDPPLSDGKEYMNTAFGQRPSVSLDALLAAADIVTCHVPLTKQPPYPTFHLADMSFFRKMKPDAFFINSSRGAVTDTEALRCATAAGRLSGFALDVWENEPLPDKELLHNAFIATPHIAGYSADGKANGTAACVREFAKSFNIKELYDWFPTEVPPPSMPLHFCLDGTGKSAEQIIYEAVIYTYPVMEDSALLKSSPETFEKQRGNYRIRREFSNFTVNLSNTSASVAQTLEMLGFTIA